MSRIALLSASLVAFCSATGAQTNGAYTAGAAYTVEVSFKGDALELFEPSNGKRSVYQKQADGLYHFTNPTNGIRYTLEVKDARTLIANKPGATAANGTPLRLVDGGAATAAASDSTRDQLDALAQRYLNRAQTDPANVQAWTFCGFAAMARAQGGGEAQVLQSAQALRLIASASTNPCSDAIPDRIWKAAE